MKTRALAISFICIWAASCGAAVRHGDEVIRTIGDEILLIASRNGDEIARTAEEYADDVFRQTQYYDEAAHYWDDVTLTSRALDENARVLLYPTYRHSPLQADFVEALQTEAGLSENQAVLYLQTMCAVADYVEFYAEYPSTSYAQFYAEQIAEENGILIFSISDFAESVVSLTEAIIEENYAYTRQEAAAILFEGFCLVSS